MADDDDFEDDGMGGGEGGPPERLVALPSSAPSPRFFVERLVAGIGEAADPRLARHLRKRLPRAIAKTLAANLQALGKIPPGARPRVVFGLLDEDGTLAVPPEVLPPKGTLSLDTAEPLGEEELLPFIGLIVNFVDDVARGRGLDAGPRALLAAATAWAAASAMDHAEIELADMPGLWRVVPLFEMSEGEWQIAGEPMGLHESAHGLAESTIAARLAEEAGTWTPARLFAEIASWMASQPPTPETFTIDDGAKPSLAADGDHAAKTDAVVATWRHGLRFTLTDFGIDDDAAETAGAAAEAALAEAWRRPIGGLQPVLALQSRDGTLRVPGPPGKPPRRADKPLSPAWRAALAGAFADAFMAGCVAARLPFGLAAFASALALQSLLSRFDGGQAEIGGDSFGHRLAARDAAGRLAFPPARARLADLALPAMKRRFGSAGAAKRYAAALLLAAEK